MSNAFTVADFLVDRLAEIGINHLFGVPGDYNLAFLDHVISHPTVRWVGTANELNAAYAADGYARCKGAAALLTTFGVGELSAINGVAGSYAEYVPVLHIVGAPPTAMQQNGDSLHHTFADGDFSRFVRMSAEVTVCTASLSVANAVEEIDRVLIAMLHHRRPGYIVLPTDVARAPLSVTPGPLHLQKATCDRVELEAFSLHAASHLATASKKAILSDILAARWGCTEKLEEMIRLSNADHAVMMLGKGTVDETLPGFLGTYIGAASEPHVREAIESSDALITVGSVYFDVGTAVFSHQIDSTRVIDIQPFSASVAGIHYPNVPIADALDCLISIMRDHSMKQAGTTSSFCTDFISAEPNDPDEPITQRNLWRIVQNFVRPGDILVAEQGTSYFGIVPLTLPKDIKFLGQPLWGSIGYAIPATYGAQLAMPDRRTILLVGDGSALLTAQEIGSMLRDGTKPIILLLNNNGYTVERAIHGPIERYNDIPQWNWQLIPLAMGLNSPSVTRSVATVGSLISALGDTSTSDCMTLIEVLLPELDVPPLLRAITEAVAAKNAGQ